MYHQSLSTSKFGVPSGSLADFLPRLPAIPAPAISARRIRIRIRIRSLISSHLLQAISSDTTLTDVLMCWSADVEQSATHHKADADADII